MSDDAELQRIRAARLQQLAAQSGSSGSGSGGLRSPTGGAGATDDEERKAEASARASVLNQILTPEASDRLGRIALVNSERARDIENRFIAMARAGQLRSRATEDDLVRLLEGLRDREKEAEGRGVGKVVFSRRKGGWDDEDDF